MSKRILLALSIVLIVGGLWTLWLLDRRVDATRPGAPVAASPNAPPPAQTRDDAGDSKLAVAAQDPSTDAERAAVETTDARATRSAAMLVDAVEVRVHVQLPQGCPSDEKLELVALSFPKSAFEGNAQAAAAAAARFENDARENSPFPQGTGAKPTGAPVECACELDALGNGVARFAKDSESGFLRLSARYSYLEAPHKLALASASEVNLAPALGAWFSGRVQMPASLPSDFDPAAPAAISAFVTGWSMDRGGRHSSSTEVGADFSFEFGGLRPQMNYFLQLDPHVLAATFDPQLVLEPGAHETRDYALKVGGRARGIVLGDDGKGVAGARVWADIAGGGWGWGGAQRSVTTDREGRFDLRGVTAGKGTIAAEKEGFVDTASDELELLDGGVLDELTLRLSSGATISGRVLWPDGAPAVGAKVVVRQTKERSRARNRWVDNASHEVTTDSSGHFERSGLAPSAVTLTASAEKPEGAIGGSWTAKLEDAKPGTAVELKLAAPLPVHGRVVDVAGRPLRKFSVRHVAESENDPRMEKTWPFESEAGEFVLYEPAGAYKIAAQAEGYTVSEEQAVTLPGFEGVLVFTLQRAGSITGRVLGPDGAPVAKATVSANSGSGNGRRRGGDSTDAVSDVDGSFEFSSVAAGNLSLNASAEGFAPSDATLVTVEAGLPVADVQLMLRVGGRVEGEIFAADGRPDPGRQIVCGNFGGGMGSANATATSDAAGHFVLEHLAPGKCSVMAVPDMKGRQGGDFDQTDMLAQLKMTSVEVVDGETIHVVLGAPPKSPVLVTGRVTEGGSAFREGSVMALAEGGSILESMKAAKIGADGSYALKLDKPGDYTLIVGERMGDESGVEFPVSIPEVPTFALDLALPVGEIHGRISTRDGTPLAGIPVNYEVEGRGSIFMLDMGRNVTSDDDGRFVLRRLKPASYTLRVGARNFGTFFGDKPNYGTVVRSGIVVKADQIVEGVDVRLDAAGKIAGKVLGADGKPAMGASVFVRDNGGRIVNPLSGCSSNADGVFEFEGAAPGAYTVSARADQLSSRESAPVQVLEGQTANVEVRLEPGTTLRVLVEDGDGKLVRAGVRVLDDAGRDFSNMLGQDAFETVMTEGFSSTEQRFGPLPSGKYRVLVTGPDGAGANKPVTLSGQDERSLRVRLQ